MNDDKAENIALFRYGLIAPLVLDTLPRGELTRRAQEIAARLYDIPHSARRQVSVDTLLDWTLRYRRNGLTALAPKPRQDRGQQRAVAPETAALVERLKRENPHRTGTALLRELAPPNEQDKTAALSASTLYRFLRARGLTERQLLLDKAAAHKKYEAEFANQTWQSDMLFGPWVQRGGGGKIQVFLQATLDDASRLIPHAQFYPNQGLDSFLDCPRQATAARVFTASPHTNLYKILYIHFTNGSALDLLRQIALALDLEPAHFRGDLVRQIADAIVRLNQSKKQHPILIRDEAHLLPHPALEQLPLLMNVDMDSSRYLTLLLIGQPLLRRTLSLGIHEALRQRIGVHYHLEGLMREELDSYLTQQLKAAGVTQPLFDDTARQGLYEVTKGIPRKVDKLAMAALRLAAARKVQLVDEAVPLDATTEALP